MNDQKESRIAIRFGGSSSKGPKGSPRPAPSSTLGKRHRPRFNNEDDSDADGADIDEHAQHESITHFGANGAEYVDEERTRRDRERAEDRRRARQRTKSPTAKPASTNKDEVADEEPLKYGLTIAKKPKRDETQGEDTKRDEDAPQQQPKTDDERAMDALLGKDTGEQGHLHRTEDDAYRDAAAAAPEVDDLATYDAIPVEGFGASLLKGQGWDGKMRGPKAKDITRRPNGMGLGAKKLKAEEDLGAWDSKGKGKTDRRPRLDEYRREKEKEKSRREDRHRDSYRTEREKDRHGDRVDRDGERDRDRDSYRHRDNRDRDRRR